MPDEGFPTEANPRLIHGYQIALCRRGGRPPAGGVCVDQKRRAWCYAKDPYRPHMHYIDGKPIGGPIRYATCEHGPQCLIHDDCPLQLPGGYHSTHA